MNYMRNVGDIISIIDMPPVDESIWWRGKRGYEVGFFPSQCVEVIGEMANNHPIPHGPGKTTHMKPVAKKREKRPLSVYDNRPVSVYDNVNQRDLPTQRYSSPVFNCKSIPEESRYSMPANTRTPPLPRSYKGSGPDERLAITGARLAQSSIL
ncbi:Rho GTPase-activating protein 33 [Exaiptasia diaphana]|nr:Rho GTPase-activating protein 33 [Exaiptasia diaphana]